jgi:hypothetical protein
MLFICDFANHKKSLELYLFRKMKYKAESKTLTNFLHKAQTLLHTYSNQAGYKLIQKSLQQFARFTVIIKH